LQEQHQSIGIGYNGAYLGIQDILRLPWVWSGRGRGSAVGFSQLAVEGFLQVQLARCLLIDLSHSHGIHS